MKHILTAVIVASLGAVAAAQAAGNVEAGKAKSAVCVGCHGANGQGVPRAEIISPYTPSRRPAGWSYRRGLDIERADLRHAEEISHVLDRLLSAILRPAPARARAAQ
jgi:cytochrome c